MVIDSMLLFTLTGPDNVYQSDSVLWLAQVPHLVGLHRTQKEGSRKGLSEGGHWIQIPARGLTYTIGYSLLGGRCQILELGQIRARAGWGSQ